VLHVAEQHDLYFKSSKCTFHASSIDYLGVIIEKGMTRMDPVKIAGIKNWPIPAKVRMSVLSWILQFLLSFYLRIRTSCTTTKQINTKRCRMVMGKMTAKGI
jgi:hypothetical protein